MSRTSHLKELQNELRQLFDQGITEQEAYDQLKDDPRFGTLRLAKVTTIYKDFRSKKGKKPKHHKPANSLQFERLLRSEQLAYFHSMLECDHKKEYGCLKYWLDQSPDGRFFVPSDLVLETGNRGNISLIDTFSNNKSQIKIPLDPVQDHFAYNFYPLTYDFGLLTMCADYDDQRTFSKISVTLLEIDWTNKKTQMLHSVTIEYQQRRFQFLSIIVDEMDPENFVLNLMNTDGFFTLKCGSVVNNEILLKEDIQIEHNRNCWTREFLAANKLRILNMSDFLRNMVSARIIDLNRGTQDFLFQMGELPDHILRAGMFAVFVTPDRVFMAIEFKETQNYGIIWSKLEAQQWNELDFCVKEPITDIKFIGNVFLVQTVSNETRMVRNVHRLKTTLYRIPLKKPEKLANLAWFNLVRSKSQLPNVDPYEEAHKYLPYNSEIRAPFEE